MNSNPLKLHADTLRAFWAECGERRKISNLEWHETIALLQRLGEVHIYYGTSLAPKRSPLEKRRAKFDRVKNIRQRYMFKKGDVCMACGGAPNVRHHIIWLKHGGRNCRRNVCFLCNACHAEIHPWLREPEI